MKTKSKERICKDIPLWKVFGFGFHFSYCLDFCIPTTTSFPFISWCNILVLDWIFSRDCWPTSFKLFLLTELCLIFFSWFLNVKNKYPFSWCYDPFFSKPSQDYYISALCTSINYNYLGYVWIELVKHMQKYYKWTNRRKQCGLDLPEFLYSDI